MISLPIVDGGETCFSCPAPCCTSYVVPLSGFDLWRLVRGLQLPWREVAWARPDRAAWEAFAVDASDERLGFFLRNENERCRFLMILPGGQARCAAHSSRPLACRVYPYTRSENNQLGIEMISHMQCPPAQRAHFEAHQIDARPFVHDELSERPLYAFAVSRWNHHVGSGKSVDEFVEWMLALYDAIRPLRSEDEWQKKAQRLINDLPF